MSAVASRVRSTSPAPRRPAGDGLGRDGEGVEGEGEEGPDRRGHLVGRERHVAQAGGDPRRHEEHRPQGEGAHEQGDAAAGGGEHPPGVGAQRHRRAAGIPDEDDDEGGRHPGLGDDGAPRRPGDAPAEAVDEPHVEGDVEAEPADGGDERGAGVLQAAQDAGRREDDEHRGDAERGDPQVGDGLVERGLGGAEAGRPARRRAPTARR